MKNILLAFTVVTVFAACNSKKSETRDIQLMSDSSAYNNSMYTDTMQQFVSEPVPVRSTPKSVTTKRQTNSTSTTNSGSSTNSGANTSGAQTSQTTTQKKGWSSRAKGTVIGAGVGAIGGAIISKKKGKGAVIGGVAGAAGGYIIGNEIDKKNNR